MKKIVIVLSVFVSVILGIAQLFAMQRFSSLQSDMVIDHPKAGRTEGKLYMKGEKSRIEFSPQGQKMVSIIDGDNAYTYSPGEDFAVAIPIGQAKAQVPEIKDYKTDCQQLGDEIIDGKDCGIYQCMEGDNVIKVWVSKDIDFPLKVIAGGATTYYKNAIIDAAIDDSLFALPAGMKVQDMSQMMQMNPAASPDDLAIESANGLMEDAPDDDPKDDDYIDTNKNNN